MAVISHARVGCARACRCRCHRRYPNQYWTPDQDEAVRRYLKKGYTLDQMVDHLSESYRVTRTTMAIRNRISALGLSIRTPGWHSAYEVARDLGVTQGRVRRWIGNGQLEASRHTNRWGASSPWWHIRDVHLQAFVNAYAGRLFSSETVRDPALKARAEIASTILRRVS